jgi:hypothetical protein
LATGSPSTRFAAGLLTINVSTDGMMIRVHHEGQEPIYFGPPPGNPPRNRFDAPRAEYLTLYAAARLEGAFVETILRKPIGRILRRAYVHERVWTTFHAKRPLTLAKIYDEGLQIHGIDAGLISADDYAESRNLALDFYQSFPTLDGLAYRSRYNNGEICYALFDRVEVTDLLVLNTNRFDENPIRVKQLMSLYRAVFDTSLHV